MSCEIGSPLTAPGPSRAGTLISQLEGGSVEHRRKALSLVGQSNRAPLPAFPDPK